MTDPYALPDHRDGVPAKPGRPAILWVALAVALALNGLSSIGGWPLLLQFATGLVTLICGGLLIARRVRRR